MKESYTLDGRKRYWRLKWRCFVYYEKASRQRRVSNLRYKLRWSTIGLMLSDLKDFKLDKYAILKPQTIFIIIFLTIFFMA